MASPRGGNSEYLIGRQYGLVGLGQRRQNELHPEWSHIRAQIAQDDGLLCIVKYTSLSSSTGRIRIGLPAAEREMIHLHDPAVRRFAGHMHHRADVVGTARRTGGGVL